MSSESARLSADCTRTTQATSSSASWSSMSGTRYVWCTPAFSAVIQG